MLKKKPLWLRIKQSYYTWRQNLLVKLGTCVGCGWRKQTGNYFCDKCFEELHPYHRDCSD